MRTMENFNKKTNQFLSFKFERFIKKLFLASSRQYQPQAILVKRHSFHLPGNRYSGPPHYSDATPRHW